MSYTIVGFGEIGQALAHAFARKYIDVTVASRRPPEALAPKARAIGPTVVARFPGQAAPGHALRIRRPWSERSADSGKRRFA
jgi:predicted dinucleotide-binding enzyme